MTRRIPKGTLAFTYKNESFYVGDMVRFTPNTRDKDTFIGCIYGTESKYKGIRNFYFLGYPERPEITPLRGASPLDPKRLSKEDVRAFTRGVEFYIKNIDYNDYGSWYLCDNTYTEDEVRYIAGKMIRKLANVAPLITDDYQIW